MTAVRVSDATKSFGAVQALAGVSLEVLPGELLALLGPNGAGKTTLVRSIAGRVELDGGSVELLGRAADATARRDLGLVPQEVAVYPQLTARENLAVFARLHGLHPHTAGDAVAWALEWTALAGRADEPVKRFSGGMRRRLNIACGVLHRPRLVLLDEPTVGVDPQSRERIYEMLELLRGEGIALLLTTHNLEEAEARCDRVVIIDHGRTVAAGTVPEIVARVFGPGRTVQLQLDRLPDPLPIGFERDGNGHGLRAAIADVESELPGMLERLRAVGCHVEHLEVRSPGLAQVFLELTGRELRE